MATGQRGRSEPSLEGGNELALFDQAESGGQHPEELVARLVDLAWHGRQLPSRLSPASNCDKVLHRPLRKEVAERGCHCNEVPAGWLGSPFPTRILGRGADGTTVHLGT